MSPAGPGLEEQAKVDELGKVGTRRVVHYAVTGLVRTDRVLEARMS